MRASLISTLFMVAGAAGLGAGCGAEDYAVVDGDAGANESCTMQIVFVSGAGLTAPATIEMSGWLDTTGGIYGYESYGWDVLGPGGTAQTVETQDPTGHTALFVAETPGPYEVLLSGELGGVQCTDAREIINVGAPDAVTAQYRLRAVPAAGQPAPPQEMVVEIPGGADYALGTVTLGSGLRAQGSVRDAAGRPLAGYVRAMPSSGGVQTALETFAGTDGAFSLRLENRDYDVLVVPEDSTAAPRRFAGKTPGDLALVITAGTRVDGTVGRESGAVISGARVAARAGEVPSTLATTDGQGGFALEMRTEGAASLTVVPAEGLPRLDLAADQGFLAGTLAGAGAVTITYDSGLTSREVAPRVVAADNITPVPGARVTWISRPMAGAGTLVAGPAVMPLSGSVRATRVAGADGTLPALDLTEAVYDVLVEPAAGQGSAGSAVLLEVDLMPGATTPAQLGLGTAATVRGVVTDAAGMVLGNVRVTATPAGRLAGATTAGATAVSDAAGTFALSLAGNGDYELSVTAADARHARARMAIRAPGPGQELALGTIALAPALRVSGRVTMTGVPGGSPGVTLRLLCYQCAGNDPSWPLAEAVTDAAGNFVLAVPDPGVGAEVR